MNNEYLGGIAINLRIKELKCSEPMDRQALTRYIKDHNISRSDIECICPEKSGMLFWRRDRFVVFYWSF